MRCISFYDVIADGHWVMCLCEWKKLVWILWTDIAFMIMSIFSIFYSLSLSLWDPPPTRDDSLVNMYAVELFLVSFLPRSNRDENAMILSHSFPLDTRTAFPSCMQISVRLSPLRFRENKCWHELIHHAISIDWQIYIYMEGFFRRFVSYQILYVWSKSTFSWIFSWIFFLMLSLFLSAICSIAKTISSTGNYVN